MAISAVFWEIAVSADKRFKACRPGDEMKNDPLFDGIVDRLNFTGLASSNSIRGCSEKEIAVLEKHFEIIFPRSYREFLKYFGRRAGQLFEGTDCFYEQLWDLRNWAEDLILENGLAFRVPRDAFVFSMHQGYEFLYIPTDAGDDPPVYQYVEDQGLPRLTWRSFTEFLLVSVEQHEKMITRGLSEKANGRRSV